MVEGSRYEEPHWLRKPLLYDVYIHEAVGLTEGDSRNKLRETKRKCLG